MKYVLLAILIVVISDRWDTAVIDTFILENVVGHLHGLTGSTDGHRSIAPGFKPRPGYVITFASGSVDWFMVMM